MSRTDTSSAGASAAAVERVGVDREQRALVLQPEQQRLGAVREQLRQLDQRQPVVVDEHRGLGQHHGAAGGIVEALGDPVRVAPAGGDAVQARALEGVGREPRGLTVACRDASLGPRAARPAAARLRRARARPRRDVPARQRRRRPAAAAAPRLDVLRRPQLVPHATRRSTRPATACWPSTTAATGAGCARPSRSRSATAPPTPRRCSPTSRSRRCSPSATRWAGRSPR